MRSHERFSIRFLLTLLLVPGLMTACGGEGTDETAEPAGESAAIERPTTDAVARLLADGQAVFGVFANGDTQEDGVEMGANRDPDFVFYSLERGPFDLDTMESYMEGLATGGGELGRQPFALRIPPVGDSAATATERIGRAMARGIDILVVPHVHSDEQVATVVDAMGTDTWPADPDGVHVNFLIVEDREGLAALDEIVAVPGVSVVFAGPGDLRRTFEGDMVAVEEAIQTVLAACLEQEVPCGITAGVDDITMRLEQGFRVFIVTEPEAIAVGKAVAGRG